MDNIEYMEKAFNYKAKKLTLGPIILSPEHTLVSVIMVDGEKIGYFNTETGHVKLYG